MMWDRERGRERERECVRLGERPRDSGCWYTDFVVEAYLKQYLIGTYLLHAIGIGLCLII